MAPPIVPPICGAQETPWGRAEYGEPPNGGKAFKVIVNESVFCV